MNKSFTLFLLLLSVCAPVFCRAQELPAAGKSAVGEKWFSYSPEQGMDIEPLGLNIRPSATFIIQGTPDSNKGGDEKLGLSYVIYIPLEKKFSDWALAYLELKSGCGKTIMNDLSLFDNVNNNAYPTGGEFRAHKYWLQGFFFEKQLSVLAGKFDATKKFCENRFAIDDDTQFLNTIFNASPAIEWPPDYTYGINALGEPKKIGFLEWEFNYLKADASSRNIFDHGMFTGQLNFKPRQGNYRFYGWVNTRNHQKILSPQSQKNWNYGFGLSFDQMFNALVGAFCRFGWQRGDLVPMSGGATIEWSWSTGMQLAGEKWGRKDDVLSFAVGQAMPGGDYKKAGNPAGNEGHFETYYRFQVNKFLQISPDFQVIWNPNGLTNSSQGDNDTIFVYALRAHIYF